MPEAKREQEILLEGQRSVLNLIAAGAPLRRALEALCAVVEEACPGTLCSVLLLDDARLHLRHGAGPTLPAAYLKMIDGIAIGPSVGSCGTAAHTGAPVIVTDIASDPLWLGYSSIAASFGLASCASTPIVVGPNARILGTFAIYHASAGPYDSCELALLKSISDLAAIAILNHERERALRESEERQIRATALSRVMEADIRLDGRWQRAPPMLCALLGRDEAELLAMRWSDVIHRDELESDRARFQRLLDGELESIEFRSRLVPKTGEPVWVSMNGVLVRGAVGQPDHARLYIEDITEKKRIEDTLRRSQKRESLGLLAAGLGHDLNNLLGAVLCNVNLAQLDLAPLSSASAEQSLRDAEKAIHRAAALTRQMLAYGGRGGSFSNVPIDVNDAIREIAQILSASLKKNIKVELDLQNELPLISGDSSQLQQVVMNLVINAAQAIGDRPGVIRVSTHEEILGREELRTRFGQTAGLPGDHVILEVSDTGGGIANEILANLFEPFFTTKTEGRGLGLAVIRGILNDHRAGIGVSSNVGVGTTFRACFPVSQFRELRPAVNGSEAFWTTTPGRVLVVDDEPAIRHAVAQMVRALGLSVLEAADGQEALLALVKNVGDVSLVLLDWAMPRMGGRETLAVMRERWPDVRVIVTTGGSEIVVEVSAQGEGIVVLRKPYTLAELTRAISGAVASADRKGSESIEATR